MNHAKRPLSILAGFALSTLLVTFARNAAAWTEHAQGGCATSIGATNGSAWITGCTGGTGGFSIYEHSSGWVQLHGLGSDISSDGSGNLGLVNAQGNIYFGSISGNNLTWNQVSGCATSIAVTSDQNVNALITGCTQETGGFGIFYYDPGNEGDPWIPLPGAAVHGAVNSSGDMWVINNAHQIFEWNPSSFSWRQTSGLALSIAVDPSGNVWVVGTNGNLFVSTTHGATWTQESSTVSSQVSVDASGNPWTIDNTGAVFSWSNP